MRPSGRKFNELRKITLEINCNKHADGSCLVSFGDTKIICTVSVENKVPPFLRNSGSGWITAEYGMLPRSTSTRMDREASRGKQNGRTQEIQRLIGRSFRSVVDLKALGERQLKIDCDVIQADGGTRVASICGSYVALYIALHKLMKSGVIATMPLKYPIAAVSCGIFNNEAILDLDYAEDSNVSADSNFVMNNNGEIIEIQITGEKAPISKDQLTALFTLAEDGIKEIIDLQNNAIHEFLSNEA